MFVFSTPEEGLDSVLFDKLNYYVVLFTYLQGKDLMKYACFCYKVVYFLWGSILLNSVTKGMRPQGGCLHTFSSINN